MSPTLIDFLLDGPWCQQAVDGHLTFLTDAPGSLTCLNVCAGVPVRVKDDDPVGAGQGDPQAAHARGQQEQVDARVL